MCIGEDVQAYNLFSYRTRVKRLYACTHNHYLSFTDYRI